MDKEKSHHSFRNSRVKRKIFLFTLLFQPLFLSIEVFAAGACLTVEEAISEDYLEFSKSLHQKYPNLYLSAEVIHEQKRLERMGMKTSDQPSERIAAWLNVLEQTHKTTQENTVQRERLINFYLRENVIKPQDVPENYFKLKEKIAKGNGNTGFKLTLEKKRELIIEVMKNQASSLKEWADYLLSKDSSMYPFWTKYWAFTSMVKMGIFDFNSGQYSRRSKGQVAPFPELNREALALTIDGLIKNTNKKNPENYNFSKQYGKLIRQAKLDQIESANNVNGVWIKYNRGSDHQKLVHSLRGKNTGWCTAEEGTAKNQLSEGDFHIYYSFDKQGEPTIPRVAIRFFENNIEEVKGIDLSQHLDVKIASTTIVADKLRTFGQKGEHFAKASSDAIRLGEIESRIEKKLSLSKQDIRFLYEIDDKIQSFGYETNPTLKRILETRDAKKDLGFIFNIDPSQISLNEKEALSGNILYHYGDLTVFDEFLPVGTIFPRHVQKSVFLPNLEYADGIIFPQRIDRNFELKKLKTAEGLDLPQIINGDISLGSLEISKDFDLSQRDSYLQRYKKEAEETNLAGSEAQLPVLLGGGEIFLLPQSVGEPFDFSKIDIVDRTSINSIEIAKNIILPASFKGKVYYFNKHYKPKEIDLNLFKRRSDLAEQTASIEKAISQIKDFFKQEEPHHQEPHHAQIKAVLENYKQAKKEGNLEKVTLAKKQMETTLINQLKENSKKRTDLQEKYSDVLKTIDPSEHELVLAYIYNLELQKQDQKYIHKKIEELINANCSAK